MQKGFQMLLLGGVFVLLGLFTMPMKRANPKQNLVDNPIGWGLFGFGLSSLIVGITNTVRERQQQMEEKDVVSHVEINKYTVNEKLPDEQTY
jgi:hypothetical protein